MKATLSIFPLAIGGLMSIDPAAAQSTLLKRGVIAFSD